MKITLFLLGEKGYFSLTSLDAEKLSSIANVIIGKDVNVQNDFAFEIEQFCQSKKLQFAHSESEIISDYAIAIGWRKMIEVAAKRKIIVLHDSILPRYRGFNPLVTALINGDKEIGVTALFGEKTYDTGDIIAQEKIGIDYPITIQEAITKIAVCYANILQQLIQKIVDNKLKAIPQKNKLATYSLWRDKEDYFIDWNQSAKKIVRFIDAVGHPYDGAKFRLDDELFTVHKASVVEDVEIENRTPGKLIFKENENLHIVCKKGIVCLEQVKDENQNIQKFESKFRLRLK